MRVRRALGARSITIAAVTSAPFVTPARRIATTRAAGVQMAPGTYFASIETISTRSETP
jgi:hypothetical protein